MRNLLCANDFHSTGWGGIPPTGGRRYLGALPEVPARRWNGSCGPHRLCDVIGTHSARRTFVVHALEMGWSPQLVMSYTGHEDYDTMKPYIALTDKTRKNLMTTMFSK